MELGLIVAFTVFVGFVLVAAAGYAIDASVPEEPDEVPVARAGR